MKFAVIGSRTFYNYDLMKSVLDQYEIHCIVSGGARGADALAERYAKERKIEIQVFKPSWQDFSEPCTVKKNSFGEYNALAGLKRNTFIIENSDIVVAFWDYASTGTKDSIEKAEKLGKKCIIIDVREHDKK